MKFESISDLFFIVAVFVPGFIYRIVLANFVPVKQGRSNEVLMLGLLTATAVNYALCSPLIYLLLNGMLFASSPTGQAAMWFVVVGVVPVFLALVSAYSVQRDWAVRIFRRLRLRSINPIPTGWDWIFGRTEPCYMVVKLRDGTEIAGYFGARSMASSDAASRDIFIEKVYRIRDEGPWQLVERSNGIWVDGSQISSVEFQKTGVNHDG
jgi:hypothetical protein